MKAVLHSDTCGCRLIATPGFLTCAGEQPRSALGHVWTAPWQELFDALQHWSGAVTCPAC